MSIPFLKVGKYKYLWDNRLEIKFKLNTYTIITKLTAEHRLNTEYIFNALNEVLLAPRWSSCGQRAPSVTLPVLSKLDQATPGGL